MAGILSYSGITAKVRAMRGKLLKPEDYIRLSNCTSVGEALGLLKQNPEYSDILQEFDEASSHRGSIEALLINSLYQDYTRLYLFADISQRLFLDMYFMHYEVSFLKGALRSAFAGSAFRIDIRFFLDFFEKHSSLNVKAIAEARTIDEFISSLFGTAFYAPMKRIQESEYHSLFDYELGFDLFYFSYLWKQKDKVLKGKQLQIITDSYGKRIDLLNIQWIMRSKRFYHMSPAEIYAMVIPCYYHLKPADISAMAEAESFEMLPAILAPTYYGRRYSEDIADIHNMEVAYIHLLESIYELADRRNPYSVAPLNAYLYAKEHEINRITSLIEGIRYGVPSREVLDSITKPTGR